MKGIWQQLNYQGVGRRYSKVTGEVNWVQIDVDKAVLDADHMVSPEEHLHNAMLRQ
jgi:hypothetical protein